MGFALEFILNQAELGADAADFIFGADLTPYGLREYMELQSAAFHFGRVSGDLFQGLVGLTQIVSGVGTIVASIGAGGASVAAVPATGGLSLAGGVVITKAGVASGAAQVAAGAVLMAKSGSSLAGLMQKVPKSGGMNTRAHAQKLKANLKAADHPKPADGYDAHHIVPSTWSKTLDGNRARAVLQRVGLHIDTAENGVWLPEQFHRGQGIHTRDAVEYIANNLELAEQAGRSLTEKRAKVTAGLREIADKLRAGRTPW
ncbi:MAG: AHH domain-containing protein [Firmicutes bacterium]|nr:AHH domain-containing protein [Bacillota bacterium]